MSDKKRPADSTAEGSNSKKLKSDVSAFTSNSPPGLQGDYSSFEHNSDVTSTTHSLLQTSGPSNGSSKPPGGLSTDQLIAQKRAEIAAKLAAMKNPKPTLPAKLAVPIPKVPIVPATTPSNVVLNNTSSSPAGTPGSGTPLSGSAASDLARRVAEAKRRVAEAQSKLAVKDNPYTAFAASAKKGGGSASASASGMGTPVDASSGSGLKMAAHPLLLDPTVMLNQSKKDRYKPMQPKFASIKANVRNAAPTPPPVVPSPASSTPAPGANPYSVGAVVDMAAEFEGAPRERQGRQMRFNPKGKYVAMANQMRSEQQLEELKQRIAESARKAGLDSEMGVEKSIKRAPPPDVEWWDSALLPNKKYDDIENLGMDALPLKTQDSVITIYVQHPIPIPAPGDKNKATLKPLMLTTKEQKKMRKLRRKEALQDKRDRIRMGLLPPDAPKVRLANLMRVLTSDAVQDPTRVEARVRREVAMRKHQHEKANSERKLTDEQRREKKEGKKVEEERKGIYGAVYKIKTLSDPSHQFKIRKNADQLNLTGLCIFNAQFNMVYVEGAPKFMKSYKRLMLNRIAWTEAARARGGEEVDVEDRPDAPDGVDNENMETNGEGGDGAQDGVNAEESADGKAKGKAKEGEEKSLEDNTCHLIWEGALRDRAFSGFKARSAETERDAKELLGERMRGYWDMAKNWRGEEEELF